MPDSVVFVPLEYLGSSDEFAWTGRATAAITAVQTSSLGAPATREAIANRARYVVDGYITGEPGSLRAVATLRDESDQRTLRTFEARGGSVLELGSSLARQIVVKPVSYTTSNVEAVRSLFTGDAEAAVRLDPKYGSAHLATIEGLLRTGQPEQARAAIAAALGANLSPLEKAQLQTIAAETPKQQSEALLAAARVARQDLMLWRRAAEAAMTAKDHRGAIEAYKECAALDPENVAIWNTLAYAQAFAGDLEGAKSSIAEYQKLQPRDPNAYDTLGEIYFYEGRFEEAEQQFLRAFSMEKARIGGGEAYRAGLAAFVAGDTARADSHFAKYIEFRKQNGDEFTPLRESIWLYSTGRAAEARKKATEIGSPAAKSQLALWDISEGKKGPAAFGDRPEFAGWKLLATGRYLEAVEYWKRIYEGSSLIAGNDARVLLAVALRGAGRESEAQSLLAKWPIPPLGPDTGFSSVVFAKAVELKKAGRA